MTAIERADRLMEKYSVKGIRYREFIVALDAEIASTPDRDEKRMVTEAVALSIGMPPRWLGTLLSHAAQRRERECANTVTSRSAH